MKRQLLAAVSLALLSGVAIEGYAQGQPGDRIPYYPMKPKSQYVEEVKRDAQITYGGVVIPPGGRIICIKKGDVPALNKVCANGTEISATYPVTCPNPISVVDIQVSSEPPPENLGQLVGDIKADSLERCYIYLPPAK